MADGVPALSPRTTEAHYFDWHHTEADTLDKVDPVEFRKNAAMLSVVTYVLADMDGRLAGKEVCGGGVEADRGFSRIERMNKGKSAMRVPFDAALFTVSFGSR